MRISERKRQLRERAGSSGTLAGRVEARAAAATTAVASLRKAPRQSTTGARQRSTAAPTRVRKQRGPRFYAGFGIIGLFFSILLIQTTISSYNHDQSTYPTKVAAYHAAQMTYNTKHVAYLNAVAHHVKPLPAVPAVPVAPTHPSLNVASFALPVLYAILSIAYLFLAYRASQIKRRSAAPPPGAK
ncbi:MAG: hypothetical protein JWO42_980 [Chloroflexi bacterium]|nr:hypothetical protein [Chloroflexota bacterium]